MRIFTHLNGTTARYFGIVGDSKTSYAESLKMLLMGHTSVKWEISLSHAVAGWTVASALSGLAIAIAAAAHAPEFVCVGLGTNEANDTPLPSQVVWESNYGSILDQIHATWHTAKLNVCKVWRGDASGAWLANCATLNGYLDNVVVPRAAWTSIAHDESNWLPGWTIDNVHPAYHLSGGAEQARQWWDLIRTQI